MVPCSMFLNFIIFRKITDLSQTQVNPKKAGLIRGPNKFSHLGNLLAFGEVASASAHPAYQVTQRC